MKKKIDKKSIERKSTDVACPTNFSTSFIFKFETAKYINKAKQAQEVL
jgi:hypothetical protein